MKEFLKSMQLFDTQTVLYKTNIKLGGVKYANNNTAEGGNYPITKNCT